MADNDYDIATDFPNGVLQRKLAQEMPAVWPADVFPVNYTMRGNPSIPVTTGTLRIETARQLTRPENDAALAHFATHDPSVELQGITLDALPSPNPAGQMQFVRDAPRGAGGTGTMLYSDGTVWRRFSDDVALA